jgi:hypothetical protein
MKSPSGALPCAVGTALALLLTGAARAGPNDDALVQDIVDGDVPAVKALLRGPANVNARDEVKGAPVLERAIAGLDWKRRFGFYPEADLQVLEGRQTEALKLLIGAGADLEERDNDKATALVFAAGEGGNDSQSPEQIGAVKLLLEHGAHVDAANLVGDTALHQAARRGYLESIRLLLAHGANRTLRNAHGETALDLAKPGPDHPPMSEARRREVIALLSGK